MRGRKPEPKNATRASAVVLTHGFLGSLLCWGHDNIGGGRGSGGGVVCCRRLTSLMKVGVDMYPQSCMAGSFPLFIVISIFIEDISTFASCHDEDGAASLMRTAHTPRHNIHAYTGREFVEHMAGESWRHEQPDDRPYPTNRRISCSAGRRRCKLSFA